MKGAVCLVISDNASRGKKNYCLDCANAILGQAQIDLDSLNAELHKTVVDNTLSQLGLDYQE
jgi:hypothetical protein